LTPLQTRGQAVFSATCSRCHSTIEDSVVVGPSMAGIASRAGERIPGMDARAYITQSILEPDAYIVEGFSGNLMPKNLSEELEEEDIEALVAYLLTLEN